MDAPQAVCIVDTDDTISKALSILLRRYGIQVHSWHEADQFVTALEGAAGQTFCVLIGLDSTEEACFDLIRQLRQLGYRFPVIVLSNGEGDRIRESALAAGATDVVEKAIVYPYLFSRLNRLIPGGLTMPDNIPTTVALRDGTGMTVRMIDPDDSDMHQDFVTGLSEESRYLRFFSGLRALPPAFLKELTSPDFPYTHAIIGTVEVDGVEQEIGVARYAATKDPGVAEFAVVVADDWHGLGIGKQLMRGIVLSASIAGFRQLEGMILRENKPMPGLARSLDFHPVVDSTADRLENTVRVRRDLHAAPAPKPANNNDKGDSQA